MVYSYFSYTWAKINFSYRYYRWQAISIDKNRLKSIIFKVLPRISFSDSPHHQEKKPKFGSLIFVIFLRTFKVSLLLISVVVCKKAIGGLEIGSNWAKNSQKRMFLKCRGCQIDEQNITLYSIDLDELCRISTCILQMSHSQICVGSAEI